jgi:hypothetical protein
MAIMLEQAKELKNVAMVLDRIVLVNQTSTRLGNYGINHGVMQADHWRYRPYEKIQVCSAQTLESRVVQDSDRLEAIGAIGIARAFATGVHFKQIFFDSNLPKENQKTTIGHFYQKLL